MASYFQQILSMEQEELLAGNEVESDLEAVEAAGEAEAARQEAEAMGDEIQRTSAILTEVENNNDTLASVVEKNGELTPEAAAGFELARRTAAAGLGIDPNSDQAEGLVDAAGLESMVQTGVLALEEAKKETESFWAKLKKLWDAFVQRCKDFWNWLMKVTNFVDKKYKATYAAVKAMSDDDFKTKFEALQGWFMNAKEIRALYIWIDSEGKLFDIDREANAALSTVESVQKDLNKVMLDIVNGKIEAGKETDKVKEILAKSEIKLGNTTIKLSRYDSGFEVNESSTKSKKLTFTRKDLENVLNVGTIVVKRIDKMNTEASKQQKEAEALINKAAEKAKSAGKEVSATAVRNAINANAKLFKLQSTVTKLLNDGLKAYLSLGTRITGAKAAE